MNRTQVIKNSKKVFSEYSDVENAYLHGSFAQENNYKKNDIDFAVHGKNLDLEKTLEIKKQLQKEFNLPVDIALLKEDTYPLFAHQVFKNGVPIVERNRTNRLLMETGFELKYFDQQYFRSQMSQATASRLGVT